MSFSDTVIFDKTVRPAIIVGTVKSLSEVTSGLQKHVARLKVGTDEAFVLHVGTCGDAPTALILANEPFDETVVQIRQARTRCGQNMAEAVLATVTVGPYAAFQGFFWSSYPRFNMAHNQPPE